MSFGRPPSFENFKVTPPQRGAFPLDHDGECREFMNAYLSCLKSHSQTSVECRLLSKDYLECRMSRGLMDRAEWSNLGFKSEAASSSPGDLSKAPDHPK